MNTPGTWDVLDFIGQHEGLNQDDLLEELFQRLNRGTKTVEQIRASAQKELKEDGNRTKAKRKFAEFRQTMLPMISQLEKLDCIKKKTVRHLDDRVEIFWRLNTTSDWR
jgi:hypothetical protein